MGFFDKIKQGLAKTKKALSDTLDAVFVAASWMMISTRS